MKIRLPWPGLMDVIRTLWLMVLMGCVMVVSERIGGLAVILPFPVVAFGHHILWGKSSPRRPIWFPGRVSWAIPWRYYLAAIVPLLGVMLIIALFVLMVFGVVYGLGKLGLIDVQGAGTAGRITGRIARDALDGKSPLDPLLLAAWCYFSAMTFRGQRLGREKREAITKES